MPRALSCADQRVRAMQNDLVEAKVVPFLISMFQSHNTTLAVQRECMYLAFAGSVAVPS